MFGAQVTYILDRYEPYFTSMTPFKTPNTSLVFCFVDFYHTYIRNVKSEFVRHFEIKNLELFNHIQGTVGKNVSTLEASIAIFIVKSLQISLYPQKSM